MSADKPVPAVESILGWQLESYGYVKNAKIRRTSVKLFNNFSERIVAYSHRNDKTKIFAQIN